MPSRELPDYFTDKQPEYISEVHDKNQRAQIEYLCLAKFAQQHCFDLWQRLQESTNSSIVLAGCGYGASTSALKALLRKQEIYIPDELFVAVDRDKTAMASHKIEFPKMQHVPLTLTDFLDQTTHSLPISIMLGLNIPALEVIVATAQRINNPNITPHFIGLFITQQPEQESQKELEYWIDDIGDFTTWQNQNSQNPNLPRICLTNNLILSDTGRMDAYIIAK